MAPFFYIPLVNAYYVNLEGSLMILQPKELKSFVKIARD
jgi:hypothetical protein